jgi:hypothetical protein
MGVSFPAAADALPRGIVLVHEGSWTPRSVLCALLQDVRVAVVSQLAHGQPIVCT